MINKNTDNKVKGVSPLDELKALGCKLKVSHYRFLGDNNNNISLDKRGKVINKLERITKLNKKDFSPHILTKGGVTEIEATFPDGITIKSEAKCTIKDTYSKKRGLAIVVNRILFEKNNPEEASKRRAHKVNSKVVSEMVIS